MFESFNPFPGSYDPHIKTLAECSSRPGRAWEGWVELTMGGWAWGPGKFMRARVETFSHNSSINGPFSIVILDNQMVNMR